jgi:hypothetical protein
VNLSTKMSYFTIKWDAHDNLIKYKFKKKKKRNDELLAVY